MTTSTEGSGRSPTFATSGRTTRSLSRADRDEGGAGAAPPRPAPRVRSDEVDAGARHVHRDDDDRLPAKRAVDRSREAAARLGRRRSPAARPERDAERGRTAGRVVAGTSGSDAVDAPPLPAMKLNDREPERADDAEDGEDLDGPADGRGHGSPLSAPLRPVLSERVASESSRLHTSEDPGFELPMKGSAYRASGIAARRFRSCAREKGAVSRAFPLDWLDGLAYVSAVQLACGKLPRRGAGACTLQVLPLTVSVRQ